MKENNLKQIIKILIKSSSKGKTAKKIRVNEDLLYPCECDSIRHSVCYSVNAQGGTRIYFGNGTKLTVETGKIIISSSVYMILSLFVITFHFIPFFCVCKMSKKQTQVVHEKIK